MRRHWPVLSLLSLCMPIAGVLAVVLIDATGYGRTGWDRYSQWRLIVGVVSCFLVIGVGISAISFLRGERWWGIALVGGLVNLVALIAIAAYQYGLG
jgi:hypothetical protein